MCFVKKKKKTFKKKIKESNTKKYNTAELIQMETKTEIHKKALHVLYDVVCSMFALIL